MFNIVKQTTLLLFATNKFNLRLIYILQYLSQFSFNI